MMFNIVYSEFLKLKKSYIFPIVLLGSIFVPVGIFISQMNCDNQELNINSIFNIMCNMNIFQIQVLNIIIISLVASYVFSQEFTNKTANILYSYPICRMKIFFAKFITIYILIALVYLINFIVSISTIYIRFGLEGIQKVFVMQLKVNICSSLLQILILPIPILIGSISKNIIIPAIYGVLGAITSMFIMLGGIYMQLSPMMIPTLPFYYFYRGDPIDFIAVTLIGGVTFIIFIISSIYYWVKIDIA